MLAIWGAVITAIGAVIAGSVVYVLTVRTAALDRKRQACAEALSDALAWREMPYRIRRRVDDAPETLAELAGRFHSLQERLLYHQSWLRIELPEAHVSYCELVAAIRTSTAQSVQDAWSCGPIKRPGDMNVGSIPMQSIDNRVDIFLESVRKYLTWWRVWK